MPCQGRWILNPVCLPFHHSGPVAAHRSAKPARDFSSEKTLGAQRMFAAQAMLPANRRESRVASDASRCLSNSA